MKIGLMEALFLVFTTLKLTGTITWSWWWVTAPLWGIPVVVLGFFLVAFIGAVLVDLFSKKGK